MTEHFADRGRLFVISGPSGAGKGTICSGLIDKRSPEELALSISMTTRKPRGQEVDGVNYYFTDVDDFLEKVKNNGFLEYAEVYGNYYGTPRKMVEEKLEQGIDVVLEIDIQGALKVKESCPEGVFMFVLPPSKEVLERRLKDRKTDSEEAIALRLSKIEEELGFVDRYDYCIVNDDIDRAVARLESIIEAEHCRINSDTVNRINKKY